MIPLLILIFFIVVMVMIVNSLRRSERRSAAFQQQMLAATRDDPLAGYADDELVKLPNGKIGRAGSFRAQRANAERITK